MNIMREEVKDEEGYLVGYISETINGNFKVVIKDYPFKPKRTVYTREFRYGFKTRDKAQTYLCDFAMKRGYSYIVNPS